MYDHRVKLCENIAYPCFVIYEEIGMRDIFDIQIRLAGLLFPETFKINDRVRSITSYGFITDQLVEDFTMDEEYALIGQPVSFCVNYMAFTKGRDDLVRGSLRADGKHFPDWIKDKSFQSMLYFEKSRETILRDAINT